MTVYCIDDIGAQEIDDGISIERVNGDTSEFWIHVHVANPTAFFDKTHTLSGLAAHMTESVYTPERSYPMIPPWATQGHFSLDRDRPVLTFSSRIDTSGNVLETNIQPGIVRKVVTMTPLDVSALLGATTTSETKRFVVGGNLPVKVETAKKPTRSAKELQDIQDMYTAARSLWARRKKAGGVRMNGITNNVRVFEEPGRGGVTWNPPSTDRARFVQGDPIIELTNRIPRSFIHFDISPSNIVEEMMMLACSTAASWCTDRKIPVMYRGTISPPTSSDALSSEELKSQHVLPILEKRGEVPYGIANRYISSLGRAIAHSSPLAHKLIGVPGYVKVTSPLRRFSDMIAHWQIEAAIRHEARHGEKLNASELTGERAILPFTHRQIQESIVTLSPREKIITMAKKDSLRFWSILALFRAFYYKEAPLPEIFRFWVNRAPRQRGAKTMLAQGVLPDYGYVAQFTDETDTQVGDEWEVQLERIDVFARKIHVKPVRLLRREEGLL
jgi:exoribonuclease R